MTEPIKIDGLNRFVKAVKKADSDLPQAVRLALNEAADVIVGEARSKVPMKTGKAKASIRSKSTRTAARVAAGGRRAPYYPWLDFGGAVGRADSVKRPFRKDGRYIYHAYFTRRTEFLEMADDALTDVMRRAGIAVDRG